MLACACESSPAEQSGGANGGAATGSGGATSGTGGGTTTAGSGGCRGEAGAAGSGGAMTVATWSFAFGGRGIDVHRDIDADSQGNVVLSGAVNGSVDFGGGEVPGLLVASLDGATGSFTSRSTSAVDRF